jgi:hypothetical protein
MLSRTFKQVADGKVLIKISGSHVPSGIERVPPALSSLRPDAALKRQLTAQGERLCLPARFAVSLC